MKTQTNLSPGLPNGDGTLQTITQKTEAPISRRVFATFVELMALLFRKPGGRSWYFPLCTFT
jgi:hypothetical protein